MSNEYGSLFYIYALGCITIISTSIVSYYIVNLRNLKYSKNFEYYILLFAIFFYILSVLILSFKKIDSLNYYADHATHLEILWRYNNGLGLTSLLSESFFSNSHWFSAHFTPIVFITYAPVFYLFPYSETLFVMETLFLTSSLIPLYLICNKYFDHRESLLFISSFLFYPTIFYMNLYGPAYIELTIPFMLWLFYFYEQKKFLMLLLVFLITLLIREEVSLVTSFFGLYLMLIKREKIGSLIFFISLIYFVVIINYVIPSYSGTDELVATSIYSSWGENPKEIILNIILNPIKTISAMFSAPRIGNLIIFLIPLMFTSIFGFFVFLIALPNLILTFFSDSISNYSFILYYLSPTIPVIFYSAIKGIDKISKLKFINKKAIIFSVFISSFTTTILFGATPISLQFWNENYEVGNFNTTNFHYTEYIKKENDISAQIIVNFIPDNASISAEQHLLPLLFKKKKILVFPTIDDDIDYVLIDKNKIEKAGWADTYLTFRKDPEKYYKIYMNDKNWDTIKQINGLMLFKKLDD